MTRADVTRRLLVAALVLMAGCREQPRPALEQALLVSGPPQARAGAYMRVALLGRSDERRRAALLWGLAACEAEAPRAALTAFSVAAPEAGAAALASRRLASALDASLDPGLWLDAERAGWVPAADRTRFALGAAEAAAASARITLARAILSRHRPPGGDELFEWLSVSARLGDAEAATAVRQILVRFPARADEVLSGPSSRRPQLTSAEEKEQAEAWLAAGHPRRALTAARRAGSGVTAARAALALRWPNTALNALGRVRPETATVWVLRAEAERQLGWNADGRARRRRFTRVLSDADRAVRTGDDADTLASARALMAEAFVELGRFGDALPLLRDDGVRGHPRWEWVRRRLLFLARGTPAGRDAAAEAIADGSTRVRRLARFWSGVDGAEGTDSAELRALADSGFPDLPAQWAAELTGTPVSVTVSESPVEVPPPPAWADDLLRLGRVSDVAVGWRAELEQQPDARRGWIGLVQLARLPGPAAIPLLVRGEPRLFTGPWTDLPRELLQQYLLLPYREALEAASRRSGVPPWILAGLVRQESAWNPTVRSSAGAVGLAQVLPATAGELVRTARLPATYRSSLTDPEVNMTLGGLLLERWRRRLGGSWVAALAAYNAGERRIRDTVERTGTDSGPEFVEAIEMPETWDYVHRVTLLAEGYRILYWPQTEGE